MENEEKLKELEERIEELETRIEHHADMIYNKLQKKKEFELSGGVFRK